MNANMTIIASGKVHDGIVLATDSMSQLIIRNASGQAGVAKTYCNARKLLQIEQLPIGVMSYGIGNIGERSIESLVLEYSRDMGKYVNGEYTVEAVSRGLYTFIEKYYLSAFDKVSAAEREKTLRLGMFIGGYSPGKYLADQWEFELPTMGIKKVRDENQFGSSWRGVPVPFGRLYNGYDPRIPQQLKSLGVSDEILKQVFDVKHWRMPIAYDGMPVQDALNFAVYILETTISAATFELGPTPSCGGPLQVVVILPPDKWQWVEQPKLRIQ